MPISTTIIPPASNINISGKLPAGTSFGKIINLPSPASIALNNYIPSITTGSPRADIVILPSVSEFSLSAYSANIGTGQNAFIYLPITGLTIDAFSDIEVIAGKAIDAPIVNIQVEGLIPQIESEVILIVMPISAPCEFLAYSPNIDTSEGVSGARKAFRCNRKLGLPYLTCYKSACIDRVIYGCK